ncbi:VENN motif pre-toxin domain-containing protein [Moraxella bovoculi]|uniref:VENN motif pre-toxin domain-containing protein n=1 Tax=Moraxella bovoculi TaxID=386891 RepID=UPI00387379A1
MLNTARLTAGSIALLYDFDVDTAANEAGVAVENNALVKFGDIQNFRLHYNRFCSPGPSAACDSIIHQWKYISYDHAGMTSQEIAEWEKGVTQIIEHYNRQCKNDVCRKHLRAQKYRYMIEYAGIPQYLYQLESSLITYIHGPRAAIATAGYQIAGSVVEAYDAVARRSVRGVNRKQVNNSEKSQKNSKVTVVSTPTVRNYQGVSQDTKDKINDIIYFGKDTSSGKSLTNIDLPSGRDPVADFKKISKNLQVASRTAKDGSEIQTVILPDGSKVQLRTVSKSNPEGTTIDFTPPGKKSPALKIRYPTR